MFLDGLIINPDNSEDDTFKAASLAVGILNGYANKEGNLPNGFIPLSQCTSIGANQCYLYIGRAARRSDRNLYGYISELRIWGAFSTRLHMARNFKKSYK